MIFHMLFTAALNFDSLINTVGIVAVALITAIGGIQIAIINQTRIHSKKTREQTENSHKDSPIPNLRDNIDVNQYIVVELLRDIRNTLTNHGEEISTIKQTLITQGNEIDELTQERLPND